MTILYHYCSTTTFLSIISNQSIWLSSLNLSNDTMEGKLIAEMINRLSKRDGFDELLIKEMHDAIDFMENLYDGLGFCLSGDGDLLSQWRGYAADATGFSIGFSKEYLSTLSEVLPVQEQTRFSLQKVEYNSTAQEELIRPTYEEAKLIINSGRLKIHRPTGLENLVQFIDTNKEAAEFKKAYAGMYMTILMLSPKLYSLKSAAFSEEKEWRLITYTFRDGEDICAYRALNDRIIPYRSYGLAKTKFEPITEVIIGPKNLTPPHVVDNVLKLNGFKNVIISQSSATYR